MWVQNGHGLAKHQERIHTVKHCCLLEQSEHGREHRGEHGERDAAAEPRLKLEAAAGGGVARRSAAGRRHDLGGVGEEGVVRRARLQVQQC